MDNCKASKIPEFTVTMSSHEEDDQDLDREDIHVDVESMDSKASVGGGGASDSEIDMDDTGSCYDDTEIAIRFVGDGKGLKDTPTHHDQHRNSAQLSSKSSRSSTETLPFSISRLLSKPFQNSTNSNLNITNNNNNNNEDEKQRHHKEQDFFTESDFSKFSAHLGGVPFASNGALYTYPFYPPGQVLRVPPRNGAGGPLQWPMPSLHPAALAHQAVKDRLAGDYPFFPSLNPAID